MVDVALGSNVPLRGSDVMLEVVVDGEAPRPGEPTPRAEYRTASPEYFEVAGIPLLRGRAFDSADRAETERVVVLTQNLADRLFPDRDPIGRRVAWTGDVLRFIPVSGDWRTVVGVVGDTRDAGPDAEPRPVLYQPFAQEVFTGAVLVRTRSDPEAVAPAGARDPSGVGLKVHPSGLAHQASVSRRPEESGPAGLTPPGSVIVPTVTPGSPRPLWATWSRPMPDRPEWWAPRAAPRRRARDRCPRSCGAGDVHVGKNSRAPRRPGICVVRCRLSADRLVQLASLHPCKDVCGPPRLGGILQRHLRQTTAPHLGAIEVGGQGEQPGRERRVVSPLAEAAIRLDERLLRHVLRPPVDSGERLPQADAGPLGGLLQRAVLTAQSELTSPGQFEVGGVIH